MKKTILLIINIMLVVAILSSCKKSEFADFYKDPSKINTTQIGQQYTGALQEFLHWIMPGYTKYFTVEQPWIAPFTQSIGKVNGTGMYKVGTDASGDLWNGYYDFLAQYREFQRVYDNLSAAEKKADSIYYITATIFMYGQTEKMVDLYGAIPWSQAGYVGQYGNDYLKALAKFDSGPDIYTTMLDSLKYFANQLSTISVPTNVEETFRNQDFINFGDIGLWQRYCNSLRLRMLLRVSEVPAFQQRYNSDIPAILDNPSQYPVVLTNDSDIQIKVVSYTGAFANKESEGWNQGIGSTGWNLDITSKAMVDFMNANNDPRRRVLFQPDSSGGYKGLDASWTTQQQNDSINSGVISVYNRTTFDDNLYYPGVMITASEVDFILAEYYLRHDGYKSAEAKYYYNNGIEQSINFHFAMQKLSQNSSRGGFAAPVTQAEINNYLLEPGVNWDNATSDSDALKLIAYQRWIHFNIVQNIQNWSGYRRLGLPLLNFPTDNSSTQTMPPLRFPYPSDEAILNSANYSQVKSQDNLNTKIFWDTH